MPVIEYGVPPTWISDLRWGSTAGFYNWTTTTSTTTMATTYYPNEWINVTTFSDAYPRYVFYGSDLNVVPPPPLAPRRQVPELLGGARTRARATLLSLLSPEEQREYEAHGRFRVRGSAGGQYIVEGHSHSMNVRRADGRQRLCAHPQMHEEGGVLPREDALIAQLLMLQFDEPGFLAIANWGEA